MTNVATKETNDEAEVSFPHCVGALTRIFNHGDFQVTNKVVGTVRFISQDKRFGFIARDDGGEDCYLGAKALFDAGLKMPERGVRLAFNILTGQKGGRATDLELV